jgi:hypothetical protein
MIHSIRIEDRTDGHREALEQHRSRRFPAPVNASFFIRFSPQAENGDRFRLRVDDPAFRNAALGIIAPFVNQIAFGLLLTHNFKSQIGASPEPVFPARIGGRKQQKEIGLTELERPDSEP